MRQGIGLALGLIALLLAVPGQADTAPMTADQVRHFVRSIYDLHDVVKDYGPSPIDTAGVGQKMSGDAGALDTMAEKAASPFSSALAAIQGHEAHQEILAVIKGHGFADMDEWGAVGDRVMRAFVALMSDASRPEIDASMAEALAQIEKSNMSPQQKEAVLKMMQASQKSLAAFTDVPESDKQLVKPHMAEIEGWERLE